MKDIPITTNDYSSYDDEYLFEMIVEFYNTYNQTNIRSLWEFNFFLDFDEEGIEDDINNNNNNNNMNLTLIKNMPPIFIILMNMRLVNMIIVLKKCMTKI